MSNPHDDEVVYLRGPWECKRTNPPWELLLQKSGAWSRLQKTHPTSNSILELREWLGKKTKQFKVFQSLIQLDEVRMLSPHKLGRKIISISRFQLGELWARYLLGVVVLTFFVFHSYLRFCILLKWPSVLFIFVKLNQILICLDWIRLFHGVFKGHFSLFEVAAISLQFSLPWFCCPC